VGTEAGIEAKVLPKEGLPVRFISAGKLKGMRFSMMARTMIMLPRGFIQSLRLLREVKPDVVIGVGGYASGPVAVAAWILRIPLIIVEPNSYAGFANRLLGNLANKVVLSFPGTGSQRFFQHWKTEKIGPLVREGIDAGDRTKALREFGLDPGKFTVLVMGGSGGAHAINMAMKQTAPNLKSLKRFQILHQTGEKDIADLVTAYRDAGVKAIVRAYIHDMPGAYAAADLVISRSGATTVAELAVCGKRAILIPFPYAADNHQEYNARTLAQRGQVDVLLQKDMTTEKLGALIHKYAEMGTTGAQRPLIGSDAAEEITKVCEKLCSRELNTFIS